MHYNLTQLVRTMHNICKVRGPNPDHQRNKKIYMHSTLKNNFFKNYDERMCF